MGLKRKIKGFVEDAKYYLNGGMSRVIAQRRLEQYAEIIESTIIATELNRTASGKAMVSSNLRKSNEHINNRATHQEKAAAIAAEVAKELGLNVSVVRIATKNHDIGHTPYAHCTEWWLSEIFKDIGMGYRCHNAIGARRLIYSADIYDRIIQKIKEANPNISEAKIKKIRNSLWLIIDPILCHNGESSKRKLRMAPNLEKTEEDFEKELRQCYTTEGVDRDLVPATAEGSLLRIVDVISYVGEDMADGLRDGYISDLDPEYRQILAGFGITDQEIDEAIAKEAYNMLIDRIETVAKRDLVENSTKNRIQLSDEMLDLICRLKDKNNRATVDKSVRPTENDKFPPAVRTLTYTFSKIFLNEGLANDMSQLSGDLAKINALKARYKDTPYYDFIIYLCNVTPRDYEFTVSVTEEATIRALMTELNEVLAGMVEEDEKYPIRTSRKKEMAEEVKQRYPNGMDEGTKRTYIADYMARNEKDKNTNCLPMAHRIGMALGANYIETLNDIELARLLVKAKMLTPEEAADIHVPYNELTAEEWEIPIITDGWQRIKRAIAQEDFGVEY